MVTQVSNVDIILIITVVVMGSFAIGLYLSIKEDERRFRED